jgi:hypothetical protein
MGQVTDGLLPFQAYVSIDPELPSIEARAMSSLEIPEAQRSKPWLWVVIIGLIGLLLAISPPGQVFLAIVWIMISMDPDHGTSTQAQGIPGSTCQVVSYTKGGAFVTSNFYFGVYVRDPSLPSAERVVSVLPYWDLIGVDSEGSVHFLKGSNGSGDSSFTVPCMDGKRPSIQILAHRGSFWYEPDVLVDSFAIGASAILIHGTSERQGDTVAQDFRLPFGFLQIWDSAGVLPSLVSIQRINPDSSGPMRHEWSRRTFLFPKPLKPRRDAFPPEAALRKFPIPFGELPSSH